MNKLEHKLRIFANYLKDSEVYVDSSQDGKMESAIKYAQEETMQQIGSLLEEVLDMTDEQLDNEDKVLE